MADAWGREERDEDPLAKLERLVNARTDRFQAETNARSVAGGPRLRGAIEDLYGTPMRQPAGPGYDRAPEPLAADEMFAGAPDADPFSDLSAVPDVPQQPIEQVLPSLGALRAGWTDDLPPVEELDEPMPRIVRDAPRQPSTPDPVLPAVDEPETAAEPDIAFGEELDANLSEAVAGALAAASAALAATQTQAPATDRAVPIAPLAVPEPPSYEPSAAPGVRPEPIDFGDDFERELVDELLQITPPPAGGMDDDPLVAPAAAVPTPHSGSTQAANDNRGRRRGAMIAAMLAGVAVLGGVGAFSLNGGSGQGTEIALVAADRAPVKVRPAKPGGREVPNQSNAVYERVATVETAQAKAVRAPAPALVSKTEDVSAIRETAVAALPTPGSGSMRASDVDVSPAGALTPRTVRTIRVRPDGTLATTPPVDADPANAPESIADTSITVASIPTTTDDDRATGVAAAFEGEPAPGIPVPRFRPIGGEAPEPVATAPGFPATVPSVPAASAQPTQPVASGGYLVQIASVPDADAARRTYADLSGRYASIIGGRGVDYQVADIPGKGTFHRVRVPAGSKAEANTVCASLKAAGGSCFVTR